MAADEANDDVPIRISRELFQELRDYADRVGIRFADFVEDALENATHREELERLLNDAAKVKAKIESVWEEAFLKGFQQGVLAALVGSSGQLVVSDRLTPPAAKTFQPARPITGGQMTLFD